MTAARIQQANLDGVYILKFSGELRLTFCTVLDDQIEQIFTNEDLNNVVLDLRDATGIDSTILGLLAKISIRLKERAGFLPVLETSNVDILRILESMGFDRIFNIVNESQHKVEDMAELPPQQHSEEEVRARVLEAHRILMGLNDSNKAAFKDLVNSLECQCS